jgi:hypothetical protein
MTNVVFMSLGPELSSTLVSSSASGLLHNGRRYTRIDDDDTHGFYDWLRGEHDRIIGLRVFLFEDYQHVIQTFAAYDYVETQVTSLGNRIVFLYFSQERGGFIRSSEEQLFTGNYIYISESGEYGMTFEAPEDDQSVFLFTRTDNDLV